MSRVTELEKALTTLFRKGTEVGYAETVITVDCAGQSFTAKGKTVLAPGWKRYEQEQAEAAPALPVVTEQQTLSVSAASVKTGKTTPPKHFTDVICYERGIRNRP